MPPLGGWMGTHGSSHPPSTGTAVPQQGDAPGQPDRQSRQDRQKHCMLALSLLATGWMLPVLATTITAGALLIRGFICSRTSGECLASRAGLSWLRCKPSTLPAELHFKPHHIHLHFCFQLHPTLQRPSFSKQLAAGLLL